MSKTQKIILYIGLGLVGLSLLLFVVNLFLQKDTNQTNSDTNQTPNTKLFSLFEIPFAKKDTDTETQPTENNNTQTTQNSVTNIGEESNLVTQRSVLNFQPIEKTFDQISFTPDQKASTIKTTRQGIRYIASDGLVYERYENEEEKLVSNTTSNRLGEAFVWGNNVVYRYSREDMQTIETFIGAFSTKTETLGQTNGNYLSKNIRSFAVNEADGQYAALLADDSRSSGQILIGQLGKDSRKNIFKTSFTDWLLDWFDKNNIVLTTRASGLVSGSAYIVNIFDLSKTKITDGYGLTTKVLPFSAGVVVSTVESQVYKTNLYVNKKLDYLPFKTIADKCTASSRVIVVCAVPSSQIGQAPDDWYKGEISYNDKIISYNTENGLQKILVDDYFLDVDIIKPSNNGSIIYFRNKNTGQLHKVSI